MKFVLEKEKLYLKDDKITNSGSLKYYLADVEYSDDWKDLIIEAILIKENEEKGIAISVINKQIYIDRNLAGTYFIGFVGYKMENDIKTYQISTNLISKDFNVGAGEIQLKDDEIPSISQWEIYIAQIQNITQGLEAEVESVEQQLENGDFDGFSPIAKVTQTSDGAKITITDKDGTTSANIYNGITQDISGKFDKSDVTSTYSTTEGKVYDVTYINTTVGNIETLLGGI